MGPAVSQMERRGIQTEKGNINREIAADNKLLKEIKARITLKAWRAEAQKLVIEKEADYLKMRAMREDIKAVETLKKTAERLAKEGQTQRREEQER